MKKEEKLRKKKGKKGKEGRKGPKRQKMDHLKMHTLAWRILERRRSRSAPQPVCQGNVVFAVVIVVSSVWCEQLHFASCEGQKSVSA